MAGGSGRERAARDAEVGRGAGAGRRSEPGVGSAAGGPVEACHVLRVPAGGHAGVDVDGGDGDDKGGDGPRQRGELHLPGAGCERGGQGRGVGADAGGDAGGTGADGLVRVGAGGARREQCVRAAPRVQRGRGGAFSEYAERHLRGDGRGVDGPAPGGPAPGPVDRDGDTVVGRCGDGGGAGKPCLRCVGGGVHGGRRAADQPSGGNGPRPSTDGVGECGARPGDGRHGGGLHAHAHGRHGG